MNGVIEADCFEQWRDAVAEAFAPLRVSNSRKSGFAARMRTRHTGAQGLTVAEIKASGHAVERTPALIAAADPACFKLSLQLSGTALLIQDHKEAVLRPGDLAVYDTSRPYTLAFDGEFRGLVLMFPHAALDLPVDAVGQLTAVTFPGGRGLGRIVSPFLARLADDLEALDGSNGARLGHNALDLLTTLFNGELDRTAEASRDPHLKLLARIHDYIEEHLADPGLSPRSIAAAHYISTRHLHDLFRERGETVSASIRERRLERCRRDLRDPVLSDRPVTAIAGRWGLHDSAHFSRIFRTSYGESPSSWRAGGARRPEAG